jgi:hypothetical protein
MRVRNVPFGLIVCGGVVAICLAEIAAQAPAQGRAQGPARGRGAAQGEAARVHGDMLQLMRGVLYPASNVIFTVQTEDPAVIKPADKPSTSSDPLTSAYGGWTAVENSGIALAEAANLLIIPGRRCGNGRLAPIQNADWQLWVQELRDAGMAAYKAAQTKNQDAILEAAGVVAESCAHCHQKYRQVPGGFANRCS